MKAAAVVIVMALAEIAHAAPRTFEISAATTTWKRGEKVAVTLTYRNTKAGPITISVYNCSWDMHVATVDRQLVWDSWGCEKNAPLKIDLAPGATKSWTLEMYAEKSARVGKHALKLTFAPYGAPAAVPSNDVAITVEN